MAAPAQAYSVDYIPMMKRAGTTWGTGIDCDAASAGIAPFYIGGFKRMRPSKNIFPTMNTVSPAYSKQTRYEDAEQSWQMYLAFEQGLLNIAQWFGDTTAPSNVDTSAYEHVWDIQDRNRDFFTYALSDTTTAASNIWELATVQTMGMELNIEAGQNPIIMSYTGVASHCLLENNAVAGNQPNTTTTSSVTNPTITQFACYEDTVFRINTQGGSGLASGDELNPSGLKVSFNRPFEADPRIANSADGALFRKGPDAPRPTGPIIVTLEATFPNLDSQSQTFIDAIMDDDQGDEWKADITIDSGTLAGAASENYDHVIQFPRLQVVPGSTEVAADQIESGLPVTLVFQAMTAASAPTGMSGVTNVRWTATNQQSTSYLA